MSETKTSPLPWVAVEDAPHGWDVESDTPAANRKRAGEMFSEADAKLVVRAVNLFPELVTHGEALVDSLRWYLAGDGDRGALDAALTDFESALAKASP